MDNLRRSQSFDINRIPKIRRKGPSIPYIFVKKQIRHTMDKLRVNSVFKRPPKPTKIPLVDESEARRKKLYGEKVDLTPQRIYDQIQKVTLSVYKRDDEQYIIYEPPVPPNKRTKIYKDYMGHTAQKRDATMAQVLGDPLFFHDELLRLGRTINKGLGDIMPNEMSDINTRLKMMNLYLQRLKDGFLAKGQNVPTDVVKNQYMLDHLWGITVKWSPKRENDYKAWKNQFVRDYKKGRGQGIQKMRIMAPFDTPTLDKVEYLKAFLTYNYSRDLGQLVWERFKTFLYDTFISESQKKYEAQRKQQTEEESSRSEEKQDWKESQERVISSTIGQTIDPSRIFADPLVQKYTQMEERVVDLVREFLKTNPRSYAPYIYVQSQKPIAALDAARRQQMADNKTLLDQSQWESHSQHSQHSQHSESMQSSVSTIYDTTTVQDLKDKAEDEHENWNKIDDKIKDMVGRMHDIEGLEEDGEATNDQIKWLEGADAKLLQLTNSKKVSEKQISMYEEQITNLQKKQGGYRPGKSQESLEFHPAKPEEIELRIKRCKEKIKYAQSQLEANFTLEKRYYEQVNAIISKSKEINRTMELEERHIPNQDEKRIIFANKTKKKHLYEKISATEIERKRLKKIIRQRTAEWKELTKQSAHLEYSEAKDNDDDDDITDMIEID